MRLASAGLSICADSIRPARHNLADFGRCRIGSAVPASLRCVVCRSASIGGFVRSISERRSEQVTATQYSIMKVLGVRGVTTTPAAGCLNSAAPNTGAAAATRSPPRYREYRVDASGAVPGTHRTSPRVLPTSARRCGLERRRRYGFGHRSHRQGENALQVIDRVKATR